MRKEFRKRLATEYRYAATKMREATQPTKKMFYFSILFGEAQRVLNWEWATELALIHLITQHVHTQVSTTMQTPALGQVLPIDWPTVFEKLTKATSDLTTYFEKTEDKTDKEELWQILGRFAEIGYAVSGNGSYLHEKGFLKL